ncbi:uncharacterized protein METZ01_LOCUS70164, partial [marine metagenome]
MVSVFQSTELSTKEDTAESRSLNSVQVPGTFNEEQDLQATILRLTGIEASSMVWRTQSWQIRDARGGSAPHLRHTFTNGPRRGYFVIYAFSKLFL